MKYIILLSLFSFQSFASEKIKEVKEGMTKEEVVKLLGEPKTIHGQKSNQKTYLYDTFLIAFENDKVDEIFDYGF